MGCAPGLDPGCDPWSPRTPSSTPSSLARTSGRSVSIVWRYALTCTGSLAEAYQSEVCRAPSANATCGSHPRSRPARVLSATRLSGPVGLDGRVSMHGRWPVWSRMRWTASMTRTRSIVPRLTAVASSMRSATASVPSTMSETWVQLRTCSPVPHTTKGSCRTNALAIIAMTAWFSIPRGP